MQTPNQSPRRPIRIPLAVQQDLIARAFNGSEASGILLESIEHREQAEIELNLAKQAELSAWRNAFRIN